MNEQQARNEGLHYTGIYDRNKEVVKGRAAKLRAEGYRAVVVTVPDSKYSRSSCISNGWSVYVEERYVKDQTAASYRQDVMVGIPAQEKHLRENFEKEMAALEGRRLARQAWLTANGYAL